MNSSGFVCASLSKHLALRKINDNNNNERDVYDDITLGGGFIGEGRYILSAIS